MNSTEQNAHNRFQYLIEKIGRYIETPNIEYSLKTVAYEEIWQLLRERKCREWSCAVHQVIENWSLSESTKMLEIVKYLVENGADIYTAKNYYLGSAPSMLTPLWLAVKAGDPNLVKFLVKRGASAERELLEHVVVTWKLPWRPLEERCMKWLLKGRTALPRRELFEKPEHLANIWVIHLIAKQVQLVKENKSLTFELERAQEYIIALECRPPELGGPEYEAGKQRWDTARKIL